MQSKRFFASLLALGLMAVVLTYQHAPHDAPSSASVASVASAPQAAAQPAPPLQAANGPWYPLVRVVDGDTVVVRIQGATTTVRLIGLNTPEVVDPKKPVQCYGPEASARAHQLLDGQTVRLESDATQAARDAYGRTLAYLFLPDGTNFEQEMIEDGYGREYTFKKPYQYQAQFRAAQAAAKAAGRGLWSACAH